MESRYYMCEVCGNLITIIKDTGTPISCCGKTMKEIVPNSVDAAKEKHVPVWHKDGNEIHVEIGSEPHPATPEHHIEWISIKTRNGIQLKHLKADEAPKACFALCDGDELEAVYELCNLHGLWVNKVSDNSSNSDSCKTSDPYSCKDC